MFFRPPVASRVNYEATREAGMAALAKSLGDGSDGLPCEKPRHESGAGVDSADTS
jgi:hypothetical protein